jgi:predicted dehydrogenase
MRIGLAGTGRIGAFHASTLAGLPEVDQVVVTDVVPSGAARLAEANGYALSPDLDDLLSRVDALVIATAERRVGAWPYVDVAMTNASTRDNKSSRSGESS